MASKRSRAKGNEAREEVTPKRTPPKTTDKDTSGKKIPNNLEKSRIPPTNTLISRRTDLISSSPAESPPLHPIPEVNASGRSDDTSEVISDTANLLERAKGRTSGGQEKSNISNQGKSFPVVTPFAILQPISAKLPITPPTPASPVTVVEEPPKKARNRKKKDAEVEEKVKKIDPSAKSPIIKSDHKGRLEILSQVKSPRVDDEQDLTDEDDDYEEPTVQRYMPGISIDVKLKVKYVEQNGKIVCLPVVVDFYNECKKRYGDESKFTYEELYLKSGDKDYAFKMMELEESKDLLMQETVESQRLTQVYEENLDDVVWLKNRPNDPLLRCIRSITDRLNIQGIVGDPSSYLKEGGDDMHYDIDDPFIDDSAMLSELKMSKKDILIKREMESEFSIWSEDEEDVIEHSTNPSNFVAVYSSKLDLTSLDNEDDNKMKLFFNPSGWRKYNSRIPKQFLSVFYEFENTSKKLNETLTDKMIQIKLNELINLLFNRLLKINPTNKKGGYDKGNDFGLDCILQYKIIAVNGKILRWIVKAANSITNAYSPFNIHQKWISIILRHNESIISEQAEKISAKLSSKFKDLSKKRENYINSFIDNIKSLSKILAQIRRIIREHKTYKREEKTKSIYFNDDRDTKKEIQTVEIKDQSTPLTGFTPSCHAESSPHPTADNSRSEVVEDTTSNATFTEGSKEGIAGGQDEEQEDTSPDSNVSSNQNVDEVKESSFEYTQDVQEGTDQKVKKARRFENLDINSEDSISSILKQSRSWRRVRPVISILKMVGSDLLSYIQMVNLNISVLFTINDTDFGHLVEDLSQTPVFDRGYVQLSEVVSDLIETLSGTKVIIPPDVIKIVILYLQEALKVDDLYERRPKRTLLLYNNSKLRAEPGKVTFKSTTRKVSSTKETPNKKEILMEGASSSIAEGPPLNSTGCLGDQSKKKQKGENKKIEDEVQSPRGKRDISSSVVSPKKRNAKSSAGERKTSKDFMSPQKRTKSLRNDKSPVKNSDDAKGAIKKKKSVAAPGVKSMKDLLFSRLVNN